MVRLDFTHAPWSRFRDFTILPMITNTNSRGSQAQAQTRFRRSRCVGHDDCIAFGHSGRAESIIHLLAKSGITGLSGKIRKQNRTPAKTVDIQCISKALICRQTHVMSNATHSRKDRNSGR
jgi:hypothetical protein